MKIFLGFILTLIAGFLGASVGLIIGLILSWLLLVVVGDQSGAIWNTIFPLIFVGLVSSCGMAGIGIGWYLLTRPTKTLADVLDPTACLTCGYDLRRNKSGDCPECGKTVSLEQKRYL
ncbi:MAG: hypothetical protein KTR15_10035 [Phycisphaeraceae bacterium]|nr:hypothetical protein [Phycisphaeraceae bacterium]